MKFRSRIFHFCLIQPVPWDGAATQKKLQTEKLAFKCQMLGVFALKNYDSLCVHETSVR